MSSVPFTMVGAAGRMGRAGRAFDLLTTRDPGRARELQIDVARFGAGTWNLLLRFQQLGGREELIYPDAGDEPLMIRIDDPVD